MTMQENRSSADIERDVEQTRAGVASTLDQLRNRMTPGELADEVWDYARNGGGGDFVRNLGRGVRDNPLPVALIGAGIAWLMTGRGGGLPSLSGQRTSSYDYLGSRGGYGSTQDDDYNEGYSTPYASDYRDGTSSGQDSGPGLMGKARDAGKQAYDAVAGAGGSVADAASRATGAVTGMASHAGDRASQLGRTATQRGRQLGDRAYRAGYDAQRTVTDFATEQPLIVAAAGLALGAALGAVMRTTDAEARLMGEASDRLKQQAREIAQQGYEQAATAASNTFEQVKEEAKAQGLTTSDAKDAAGGIGDRIKAVVDKGKTSLREEIGAAEKKVDEASPNASI